MSLLLGRAGQWGFPWNFSDPNPLSFDDRMRSCNTRLAVTEINTFTFTPFGGRRYPERLTFVTFFIQLIEPLRVKGLAEGIELTTFRSTS